MSQDPVQNEVVVKLDVSELQKMLVEIYEKQFAELKELLKPKEETKAVAVEKVGPNHAEAFAKWLSESVKATEAVTGIPSTFVYRRDLMILPPAIAPNLRDYAQVVQVERGANEARFYKINVPTFGALTSKTPPSEVSQAITTVTVPVVERGAMQVVGYEEIERSVVDLVRGIEETFTIAAAIDIDRMIIEELDAALTALPDVHYANGRTAENQIQSSDIFTLRELIAAKRKLIERAKRIPRPGELVLVCHPKQYHDLLSDTNVIKAADFGSEEPVQKGTISQILGVKIIPTDLVKTGTGAGTSPPTTYHALLFFPKAFGLAVSRDLMIEAFREPPKRAISLTASYVAGAKLIEPTYALKIITA